jgi:hypothetical protein
MLRRSTRKFLFGAAGAATTELLRVYKVSVLGLGPVHPSLWYLLISGAFVVLGGCAAIVWDDDHALRSYYFGMTFPLMIAMMTR